MTVNEAISKIHAPKGVSSMLAGLMSGDYSVLPHDKGIGADLLTAKEQVEKYRQALSDCKSDWEYWSIVGDLEYWKAVRNILEAGALNNGVLPDVEAPNLEGLVVMDAIYKVGEFGEKVLEETRALAG